MPVWGVVSNTPVAMYVGYNRKEAFSEFMLEKQKCIDVVCRSGNQWCYYEEIRHFHAASQNMACVREQSQNQSVKVCPHISPQQIRLEEKKIATEGVDCLNKATAFFKQNCGVF